VPQAEHRCEGTPLFFLRGVDVVLEIIGAEYTEENVYADGFKWIERCSMDNGG